MKKFLRTPLLLAAAVLLAATPFARAQTLAEKVPADALVYIGWQGSDSIGKSYEASNLKMLVDSMNIPEQFAAIVQFERALKKDAADPEGEKLIQDALTRIAKSPSAFFVGPVDFPAADKTAGRVGFISKIGKDAAAELAPKLNAAIEKNRKPTDEPSKCTAAGEFLVFTVGDLPDYPKLVTGEIKGDTLATKKEFVEAFTKLTSRKPDAANAKLSAESPVSLFVNWDAILTTLDSAVEAKNNVQARRMWPRAVDALGLDSLRYAVWTGNFNGTDWTSEGFLGFNAKRAGLMGFFDHKPLSDDALKLIPKSATSAGSLRFDGVRLLADIRDAAGRADERGAQQFDAVLEQVFVFTGVDLAKELFPSFSDEFLYYTNPDAAGLSLRGLVMLNKLKDPKKAANALDSLELFINAAVAQRDPDTKFQFRTEKLKAPFENTTAHVLTLPDWSPTWAIHEDTFYLATSPQGLETALASAAKLKPGETLLDNPHFIALHKKLDGQKFSSFGYYDLSRTAPEVHEILTQALAKEKAKNPEKPQLIIMPPLDQFKARMGPGLDIYWSDEAGWHAKGVGPFPFCNLLSSDGLFMLSTIDKIAKQAQAAREAQPGAPKKKPAANGGLP